MFLITASKASRSPQGWSGNMPRNYCPHLCKKQGRQLPVILALSSPSWPNPSICHSRGTKKHTKTEAASLEIMEFMRWKVSDMNPDHVVNMDQMPIPFTFHSNCTWDKNGLRTVHVRSSAGRPLERVGGHRKFEGRGRDSDTNTQIDRELGCRMLLDVGWRKM